jgi:cytochrome c
LAKPRDFIPGNKMAFPGMKDENEISNLLAYLHEATK